jgi:hypothetical protein
MSESFDAAEMLAIRIRALTFCVAAHNAIVARTP